MLLPLLSTCPLSGACTLQPDDAARVVGVLALTSKALRSRLQQHSDLLALVAAHLMLGWKPTDEVG